MWKYRRKFGIGLMCTGFRGDLSCRSYQHIGINKPVFPLYRCSSNPLTPFNSTFTAPLRLEFSVSPFLFSSFSSSINRKIPHNAPNLYRDDDNSRNDQEDFSNDEDADDFKGEKRTLVDNGDFDFRDLETVMGILQASRKDAFTMKNELEQSGVIVWSELVVEVLSRVRNDWEAAFTFFLWAGRQPGYLHSIREYHSMIAILGKMRKFDTAWSLIEEMRGGRTGTGPSLVTPQTLLILIRKYCAVHDVGKAISTFYAYRRFKFEITVDEFQNLLSALCGYKNVKDAEHLLFCNRSVFPLNTKSLNIILNGWCNVVGDLREGKRIWKEMKARGIQRDVFSYSSMMSCYSKYSNLQAVLKLFDGMKTLNIAPDRKVYNAVIHALAKAKHVKEARNLMKTMEDNGISPNTVTYNSLIMPLCRRRQSDDAREVFKEMIERSMSPTIRTYHAFFRILRTGEEVFELLQRMNMMGCYPGHDTYIMLIRKFCRWRQFDSVFKLWNEMSNNGLDHDRSSYIVLIHGLFLNGKLEESYQYYLEMKKKHLLPEPKIEEMLQSWLEGKQNGGAQITDMEDSQVICSQLDNKAKDRSKKPDGNRNFI